MDASQLRAFLSVAAHGSFSAAAIELHLTQPAISKRIAALESGLNQRLFDRMGHRVLLTPAGQTLLPRAQRLLLDLDDMALALRNLSGQITGELRVATSHHIGLRRLPAILQEYTRRYPQVTLEFDFVDSELAYAQVEQGLRELAIVTLPDLAGDTIAQLPLWQETLIPAAHKDHFLALKPALNNVDLADTRAVMLPGHTSTQQHIDYLLRERNAYPKHVTTSSYLESVAMLVSAGQGWAFLPEIMLNDELSALPIEPPLQITRALGVVHHRSRTLSNAAMAMIRLLSESANAP